MNNYIFTDSNRNKYKRITKPQAKKALETGKNIIMCPCNLCPFSFWAVETVIFSNDYKNKYNSDFKKLVNNYEFYNCTSTETGRYSAFYIAI